MATPTISAATATTATPIISYHLISQQQQLFVISATFAIIFRHDNNSNPNYQLPPAIFSFYINNSYPNYQVSQPSLAATATVKCHQSTTATVTSPTSASTSATAILDTSYYNTSGKPVNAVQIQFTPIGPPPPAAYSSFIHILVSHNKS
jgi:hypothetical protein